MAGNSQYDWEFIRPLDQSSSIAALASGNQQINQGLQGMANALNGYTDNLKQQNTDAILNELYKAQNTSQLPTALDAVSALQAQFGRGYDMKAVREAVDNRGSVLGQRELQGINLQKAQAEQAAIPQINATNISLMKALGASPELLASISGIQGVDNSSQANAAISQLNADRTYNRGVFESDRNFKYQSERDAVKDDQWQQSYVLDAAGTASGIASKYGTGDGTQDGWTIDDKGNMTQYSGGYGGSGSFAQMFPQVMNALFATESGNKHYNSSGGLTRSPKGALGVAQIMPATAAKPGYGMKPINLQTSTAEQQKEWASEYITRIAKAHNFDVPQALAAYNAGPGATDKALAKAKAAKTSNWIQFLPKETQDYVPKVMNAAAGAGGAVPPNARLVPTATVAKISGDYQAAFADLNAKYQADTIKAKTQGSLAETGKSVATWVASKKDSGLIFAGNNSFFTSASDLANMARKDPAFNNLPESAQMNILEGAYAKMNDVNFAQYVPDGDLKKFINSESQNYMKSRTEGFNQQKAALQEQAYQGLVREFQARGINPPSRASVMQMLDPSSVKPQAQPKPKPEPKPVQVKTNAQSATEAIKTTAQKVTTNIPKTLAKPEPVKAKTRAQQLADDLGKHNDARAKQKKAEMDKVIAARKKKEQEKKAADSKLTLANNLNKSGVRHYTQADLEKLLKDKKS